MLSALLGLSLSMHLMTYQSGMAHLDQTLIVNQYSGRVAVVRWEYHNV